VIEKKKKEAGDGERGKEFLSSTHSRQLLFTPYVRQLLLYHVHIDTLSKEAAE
jgi:hypothetical protein